MLDNVTTKKTERANVWIKMPKHLHEKSKKRSQELNMNLTQYIVFLLTQDTNPKIFNRLESG